MSEYMEIIALLTSVLAVIISFKGTEVSRICWAMESIDVKVFKKLQEVCSSVSEVFNLLEHELIPLENIFSELSRKIEIHKNRAHS